MCQRIPYSSKVLFFSKASPDNSGVQGSAKTNFHASVPFYTLPSYPGLLSRMCPSTSPHSPGCHLLVQPCPVRVPRPTLLSLPPQLQKHVPLRLHCCWAVCRTLVSISVGLVWDHRARPVLLSPEATVWRGKGRVWHSWEPGPCFPYQLPS